MIKYLTATKRCRPRVGSSQPFPVASRSFFSKARLCTLDNTMLSNGDESFLRGQALRLRWGYFNSDRPVKLLARLQVDKPLPHHQ